MRYPGGKKSALHHIMPALERQRCEEYREPFVGGGAVVTEYLKFNSPKRVWINDVDPAMASIHLASVRYPDELVAALHRIPIQKDEPVNRRLFDEFNSELDQLIFMPNGKDIIEVAAKKWAVQMMGWQGTMRPARRQCRWNPRFYEKRIREFHRLARQTDMTITSEDARELLYEGRNTLVYLDPPYWAIKGLYRCEIDEVDHGQIAELVREELSHFVLSYNDHHHIRKTYAWATIEAIQFAYSHYKTGTELLITPPRG